MIFILYLEGVTSCRFKIALQGEVKYPDLADIQRRDMLDIIKLNLAY